MNTYSYEAYVSLNPQVANFRDSSSQLKAAKELQETIQPHHPCRVLVVTSHCDGQEYMERCEIQLLHDELDFRISYLSYYKRYNIWLKDFDQLKHLSHYSKEQLAKPLVKPNNIGVLSNKKILAHMEYQQAWYRLCKEENDKYAGREANFLESIKDMEIDWISQGKAGRIRRGGLVFQFRLDQGYIHQEVKVDYFNGRDYLKTFLLMSDNRLQ